jgi:ribose transport system ATP-binding protein
MTEAPTVLAARDMTKDFPGTRALDGVSLELRAGEVHALLGENGAGKSTLIKIFAGIYQPTSGAIQFDGRDVVFSTPSVSQEHGVRVISQEFELVPTMTVAENIFLGHELKTRVGLLDRTRMKERATQVLGDLGVAVASDRPLESLSVADQQLVEIAKALSTEFRILILDEPTAALNAAEVDRLFQVIGRLRANGVAMLYVSHRLQDIISIAQRVTVLRDGRKVGGGPLSSFDENKLTELIVGEALARESSRPDPCPTGDTAVQLRSVSVPGLLADVSLSVRYGEVVGVTGLAGSGRSEVCQVLGGFISGYSGEVHVGQKVAFHAPHHALNAGVATLAEDRKSQGIFTDLNNRENLIVSREREPWHRTRRKAERSSFEKEQKRLKIKTPSSESMITSLSGGNQQKVLVGRAIETGCKIIVFNEPTRGVDVKAKAEIHALIRGLARDGYAIVINSSDMPELIPLTDRCLVMVAGQVARELVGDEIDEASLVRWSLGVKGEGR